MKRHFIFLIFLFVYFIFSLVTFKQYGTSIDEWFVYSRGGELAQRLLDDLLAVSDTDSILSSDIPSIDDRYPDLFPVIRNTTEKYVELYNYTYSNLYPAILFFINPYKNFEINHLLNMVFGSILFIVSYYALYVKFKNPLFALTGPVFIVFTPRLFGDIPSNPKDIPFAILYFLSLATIIFTSKQTQLVRILMLGLLFGLTASIRFVGLSLFVIYILFTLISNKRFLASNLIEVFFIFCLCFLVQVFTIPFLGLSPIQHYFYLMRVESNFPLNLHTLSFGHQLKPGDLPWYYIPGWFIVITPLFITIFFIAGLIASFNSFNRNDRVTIVFLLSLFVNTLLLVFLSPRLYDGVRHLAYLYPQIIIFACIGFVYLLRKRKYKKYILGITLINMVLIFLFYIKIFPYQVLYFNELVGGLKGAHGKFETDYWTFSYKEAIFWLRKEVGDHEVKVYTCGNHLIQYYSQNMIDVDTFEEADYAICSDRFKPDSTLSGAVIYTVERQNVPLSYVIKVGK